MPNLFLEKTIDIQAPASRVWKALQAGYASSWEVDASIQGRGADGKILKLEPEKLLKHNLLRKTDEGIFALSSVITYELREHNGMTILVARESFAEPQSDKAFTEALSGWDAALNQLKTASET
ncbi:MAG: SRPBCC domain-containing protein [Patescibacteria group bacterium]|nr:MAG: SRPBCC domain-containing protein [Patescibacteria group bacterium]